MQVAAYTIVSLIFICIASTSVSGNEDQFIGKAVWRNNAGIVRQTIRRSYIIRCCGYQGCHNDFQNSKYRSTQKPKNSYSTTTVQGKSDNVRNIPSVEMEENRLNTNHLDQPASSEIPETSSVVNKGTTTEANEATHFLHTFFSTMTNVLTIGTTTNNNMKTSANKEIIAESSVTTVTSQQFPSFISKISDTTLKTALPNSKILVTSKIPTFPATETPMIATSTTILTTGNNIETKISSPITTVTTVDKIQATSHSAVSIAEILVATNIPTFQATETTILTSGISSYSTTIKTTVTTLDTASLFGYQIETMSPLDVKEAEKYETIPWEQRKDGWNPDSGIAPNFTELPDSVTPATKVLCTCAPTCSCINGGKGVVFASSGEINDKKNNKTGNWSLVCGRIINYNGTDTNEIPITSTLDPNISGKFSIPDGFCCYNCMTIIGEPAGRRKKRATGNSDRCTVELGSVSVTNNLETGLDFQYNVSRKVGQCEELANTSFVGEVQNIAACSPSLVIPGAENACGAVADLAKCTQKVDVVPFNSGNPDCTLVKVTTLVPPAAGESCEDSFYQYCQPTCKPSCPATCVVNNTKFDAQGTIIAQSQYGNWVVMCGRKYLIFPYEKTMTFQNAWDTCCSLGMKMMSLYPPSQYYCIKENSEKYVWFERENWISGSNSGCKDARWCSSDDPLLPMAYPSWKPGEPNGDGALTANISYSASKFELYDVVGTELKPFVCEVPWTCTATCPVTTCNKDLTKFDGSGVLINPHQYGSYYNACGTNYLFIYKVLSYEDSYSSCCSIGMKLLSVETKTEFTCLHNLAKAYNHSTYFLTSGSEQDCEFNFHWCGSNTPMVPIRDWWWEDYPRGGSNHFVRIRFTAAKSGFVDSGPTENYICEN